MLNSQVFDVAIVGAGCIGSSIFYHLGQHGASALLLDEGVPSKSATANSLGMLRVFHQDLAHVKLALKNHESLLEFDADIQEPLAVRRNGCLYFFKQSRFHAFQENFNFLKKNQYPIDLLECQEGRELFPNFNWDRENLAFFEPLAGSAHATKLSKYLLQQSLSFHRQLIQGETVERFEPYENHFVVHTQKNRFYAKKVVIACGASGANKFAHLLQNNSIRTHSISYHSGYLNGSASKSQLPNYFDCETKEFGSFGGERRASLSDKRPKRMNLDFTFDKTQTGTDLYVNERSGVLGEIPGYHGIYVATGWGGTGFKFCLEIGARLAQMIQVQQYARGVTHDLVV